MKSNVGSNIQDTSTSTATIIGRYLNDVYFDLLRRMNFQILSDGYSLTTSSRDNPLPDNFGKELYVYDATNLRSLSSTTLQSVVETNPSTVSTSGQVSDYIIFQRAVRQQPTSSSTLSIVSSSASDSTQTLFIRGLSSGVELTESVTLTGTTPAVSTNSYTEIISLSKSASTVGYVTITSNSGAVTQAVIAPEDLDYRVKILRLYQAPSGSITLNIPYIINPLPLNNDYDMPLIDAADVIEKGATALAWRYKRQFAKAQEWERLYEKDINNLIWSRENQPNQLHLLNPKPYTREIY